MEHVRCGRNFPWAIWLWNPGIRRARVQRCWLSLPLYVKCASGSLQVRCFTIIISRTLTSIYKTLQSVTAYSKNTTLSTNFKHTPSVLFNKFIDFGGMSYEFTFDIEKIFFRNQKNLEGASGSLLLPLWSGTESNHSGRMGGSGVGGAEIEYKQKRNKPNIPGLWWHQVYTLDTCGDPKAMGQCIFYEKYA